MITNKGNEIITKYMLGQAPEYASYIAVGTGAKPLSVTQPWTGDLSKKSMDFEAFRVPVTSRGIVSDTVTYDIAYFESFISGSTPVGRITTAQSHNITVGEQIDVAFTSASMSIYQGTFTVNYITNNTIEYIHSSATTVNWSPALPSNTATFSVIKERLVFKAQMPPDQRYNMTEIAVFSAANNQLALGFDSRQIAGFLTTEGWLYHSNSEDVIDFTVTSIADGLGDISASTVGTAKFINSDNDIFTKYSQRKTRQESPRYLNRCLIVKGDMSDLSSASTNYITTSDISLNFSKNSPNDVIKLAISVVDDTKIAASTPDAKIKIEFVDISNGKTATYTETVPSASLNNNRYYVLSPQLSDFIILDPSFSWSRVGTINLYARTCVAGTNTYDGSYLVFDGMRIDNENTDNPLYGMVCYSVMRNSEDDGQPIEKVENSQGYIEYRMGVTLY